MADCYYYLSTDSNRTHSYVGRVCTIQNGGARYEQVRFKHVNWIFLTLLIANRPSKMKNFKWQISDGGQIMIIYIFEVGEFEMMDAIIANNVKIHIKPRIS